MYWIFSRRKDERFKNQIFSTLDQLKDFEVYEPVTIQLSKSDFPIINELNDYIRELTERISTVYQSQKQFTENASHELQTPLAVIRGQVELLIQSPRIGIEEMKRLSIVLQNSNRLSKLNGALILLSKIEHQQFNDIDNVSFLKCFNKTINLFDDAILLNGIEVKRDVKADMIHTMSEILLELLLTNLISNAIRYNNDLEPLIEINLEKNCFRLSNPGLPPPFPIELSFQRFKKSNLSHESLGLGLSIVKRVCDNSQLTVEYEYVKGRHIITIQPSLLRTNLSVE